jgi:hypothetical protein
MTTNSRQPFEPREDFGIRNRIYGNPESSDEDLEEREDRVISLRKQLLDLQLQNSPSHPRPALPLDVRADLLQQSSSDGAQPPTGEEIDEFLARDPDEPVRPWSI